MNAKPNGPTPCTAEARCPARLVIGLPESPLAADLARLVRGYGWEVHTSASPGEAARMAWELNPAAVVLPTDAAGESGWLACAKLTRGRPRARVVLVGDAAGARSRRMGDFVGAAALVPPDAGATTVVEHLLGVFPPSGN